MITILHLSDPHFGTEQAPVIEALLRLTWEVRPGLAILSGDVTQRARRRQFAAAAGFVKRLGIGDVLVIPGNHDIPLFNLPMRLFSPYRNYKERFGNDLEPVLDSAGYRVIGVKTTRRYRHRHGEVSQAQIDRVKGLLADAGPRQLRVVVTHHPMSGTQDAVRRHLLRGHDQAALAWGQAGADLLLGGHIHLPYVLPLHDHWADLDKPLWAVQAGTAVSRRTRRNVGNSVNVIRYHAEQHQRSCSIERWDYDSETRAFVCVSNRALELFTDSGRLARRS